MRIDCRRFTGSAPCEPHKHDGRACETCAAFEPVAQRVLIVKLGAAGDVLRTTCLLPAVRARYPNAQITWVTERSSAPLLDGNPYVDRIVVRDHAVERLMIEAFDVVFGLDADETGAAIATLARANHRAGFWLDDRGRVRPVDDAAQLWWAMGVDDGLKRANRRTYPDILFELCGLEPDATPPQLSIPPEAEAAIRARFASRLAPFERIVVLNTGGGARWQQKKWTAGHYAEFVRLARREHADWAVIVAGGPEEASSNAAFLSGVDDEGVIDGGCEHSMQSFGALLAIGDVVVTSDSLALHMATALAIPVVAIVGPTSPWELELYGRGEVVHADVPCLACYHRRCPLPVTCMDLLEPIQVLQAVERQIVNNTTTHLPITQGARSPFVAPRSVGR